MSDFGESVRWRRTALGLTQSDLAAKIRRRHRPVDQAYISRVESGEIDPPLSTVSSLARALGVKPWQLICAPCENTRWWDNYLVLGAQQKREVQRYVNYYSERRR